VISGGPGNECAKYGLSALSKDDFNQPTASRSAQVVMVKAGQCYTIYRNVCTGKSLSTYDGKSISHVTYCGSYTCPNTLLQTSEQLGIKTNKKPIRERPIPYDPFESAVNDPTRFAVTTPSSNEVDVPLSVISGTGTPNWFVKVWEFPILTDDDYIGNALVGDDGKWSITLRHPIRKTSTIQVTQSEVSRDQPTYKSIAIQVNKHSNSNLIQMKSARRARNIRRRNFDQTLQAL